MEATNASVRFVPLADNQFDPTQGKRVTCSLNAAGADLLFFDRFQPIENPISAIQIKRGAGP